AFQDCVDIAGLPSLAVTMRLTKFLWREDLAENPDRAQRLLLRQPRALAAHDEVIDTQSSWYRAISSLTDPLSPMMNRSRCALHGPQAPWNGSPLTINQLNPSAPAPT